MEKAISTCEVVVFSGSSPNKEAEKIIIEGIAIANKLDKISICDTYGEHLENCLNASPTVVHNNVEEIRSSLNMNLERESDYIELLNFLYSKGVKQAYITNSDESFYASNFDFHYKITPPEISTVDSTGSGDAFVAGIIYGWHNKLNFENQARLATGLGACNAASLEVCDVKIEDAQLISDKILVEPVGKKIKQIDDLPF
jgi:fructose-1-phosphate kinase PfkB-like protein